MTSVQYGEATGLHVVLGTGPVGTWTARALLAAGHKVRAVNRTGQRPSLWPTAVPVEATDLSNPDEAVRVCAGATVVYQALNPPYHRWADLFPPLQRAALHAARKAGARYVSIDNLYGYGQVSGVLTESTSPAPQTMKGRVRLAMTREVLDAHARGDLQVAVLQSSDYYGPGVRLSQFGQRTLPPLLRGRPAELLGHADMPHSYAYIEDVGRAAAVLGTAPTAAGHVWFAPHAPARTQRDMIHAAARIAGVRPRLTVMGPVMMRIGGLFVPAARETIEMMYQFTEPFVVSSAAIEHAYGLQPTPIDEGLTRTIAWYRTGL